LSRSDPQTGRFKTQTPLPQFIVHLLYNTSTTNRSYGVRLNVRLTMADVLDGMLGNSVQNIKKMKIT